MDEVKDKVLLGLVMKDGKMDLSFDEESPLPELIRFYGILMVELPFLIQHLKAKAVQEKRGGIVTPSGV